MSGGLCLWRAERRVGAQHQSASASLSFDSLLIFNEDPHFALAPALHQCSPAPRRLRERNASFHPRSVVVREDDGVAVDRCPADDVEEGRREVELTERGGKMDSVDAKESGYRRGTVRNKWSSTGEGATVSTRNRPNQRLKIARDRRTRRTLLRRARLPSFHRPRPISPRPPSVARPPAH